MSHTERTKSGLKLQKEEIQMVDGLERTEGWDAVIKWVKAWDRAAEVKNSAHEER